MDLKDHPRYKDKPVYLFFENLVLDIIGELSVEKRKVLDELNLQFIFGSKAHNWQEVIRETLQLSNTLDVAVLNEWYRNLDGELDAVYPARKFAEHFVDAYFAPDSTIDVWNEASLENARQRIEEHQLALA